MNTQYQPFYTIDSIESSAPTYNTIMKHLRNITDYEYQLHKNINHPLGIDATRHNILMDKIEEYSNILIRQLELAWDNINIPYQELESSILGKKIKKIIIDKTYTDEDLNNFELYLVEFLNIPLPIGFNIEEEEEGYYSE